MSRQRVAALVVVLLVVLVSVVRATRDVPGDFLRYHRAGRLVATGRAELLYDVKYLRGQHVYAAERREEAATRGRDAEDYVEHEWKYAPAAAVMMAPLGVLHPRPAAIVWAAWNGFLVAVLFLACWRACSGGASAWWMLAPCIALARPAQDNVQLGQVNLSAIVPATVALLVLAHGRNLLAGALAGFGTVVKYMPGFTLLWFGAKRRWSALLASVAAVLAFGLALPAAVLGVGRSFDLIGAWMDARAHHYTSAAAPDLPGHSIKSFLYRVFGETPYITGSGAKRVVVDVSIAELPPDFLKWATLVLSLGLLLWVLWLTRGRQRAAGDPAGPVEAGMFLAAIPLASPEARAPHFLYLTLAAIALTYRIAALRRDGDPRWRRAVILGVIAGLLLNADSTTLLGRESAARLAALCPLGWAAGLLLVALHGVRTPRGEPAALDP